MTDLKQLLQDKIDVIFEQWKANVCQDLRINSARQISEPALADSIPDILEAIADALPSPQQGESDRLAKVSLEHGTDRAKQGYDTAEVAREYRWLRQTIFKVLEPDLIHLSSQEVNKFFQLVNFVIDEAIIQSFNQFVREKTKQYEKVREQLLIQNQEMERLLTFHEENFSTLAHEFKTPLNSIMGYCQLLLRQQGNFEQDTDNLNIDYLDRVLRCSRQMLELINDSLEVSRYNAGRTDLKLSVVNLAETIEKAVDIILPLANSKNLEIQRDYNVAPNKIITDVGRLNQILNNFLSNAVRYTDKGYIRITCQIVNDEQWSIAIADTGIGIPEEEQEQIFEPFSRATTNDNRQGSTGLGLSIALRLVEILHGKISLQSEVGKGTTITIIFPLKIE